MLRRQRRKGAGGAAGDGATTARVLLGQLGSRLAEVAPHCSNEQLARALWAFGVSRQLHPDVVRAACEVLPRRLDSMSLPHLSTAAWALAAATSRASEPLREPVRQLLQAVGRHLVSTRPASLTEPQTPALPAPGSSGASLNATGTVTSAVTTTGTSRSTSASANGLAADAPWMDHRSAVKLAWAFATAGVAEPQVLDLIGDAAAARMATQLASHDWSSGPLQPRATYIYRTIRGPQAWPRPRPPRGGSASGARRSRYLHDERPRVVLRDFTPETLGPLLSAFKKLGHRHDVLLQATGDFLTASGGPALSLPPRHLARLVGAMDAQGLHAPAALSALLSAAHLSALPVPAAARLVHLAADWGVRHRTLYGRLVRQVVSRAWVAESVAEEEVSHAAVGGSSGSAAAVAAPTAKHLAVVDEQQQAAAADAAAAMKAAAEAAASQEVRLDPQALESWARGPGRLESWRDDTARLEEEERQWAAAQRRPRDRISAGELAGLLLKLTKIGFRDPHMDVIVPLFALLYPHLASLPRDAAAGVALAAVQYSDLLDHATSAPHPHSHHVPNALDLIRESTSVVLYGTTTGPRKPHYLRSLYENAGLGAGAGGAAAGSAVAGSEDQASQLRSSMGLTHVGAMRLAQALTSRPNAVTDKELKVALSLLDLQRSSREQLGQLVSRLRQRGQNGALPPRVLAAVGEASG